MVDFSKGINWNAARDELIEQINMCNEGTELTNIKLASNNLLDYIRDEDPGFLKALEERNIKTIAMNEVLTNYGYPTFILFNLGSE